MKVSAFTPMFFLFLWTLTAQSQNVGMGTNVPDSKAMLDISSTNKGLLIPRMTEQEKSNILNPPKGLLVFVNTDSSFHYYNGTAWTVLIDAGDAWLLGGNTGIDTSKHFIGTTDIKPLLFKVNNKRAGIITFPSADNGNLGVTAIGVGALSNNAGGLGNTAFGFETLRQNSTGSFNDASGVMALLSNTSGSSNVANGNSALRLNTTGSYNVASGFQALISNISGNKNIAIGSDALNKNINGMDNVAIGFRALYANTTGFANVAIGFAALTGNTMGFNNVANGAFALAENKTGTDNVANGFQALGFNINGNFNIANGTYSLHANQSGNYNVAYGPSALSKNFSGTGNTAVGSNALNDNYTGNLNVAIGSGANVASNNLSNAIAIGSNASVACSGCMVLGNNVNVGIGTSTPTARLHVTGNVNVSGNVTKGGGSFKIDHPLDPYNKFLYHSFVESPDMMNVYNGNITTNANGEAEITMPDWFESLNKDFRYQLTVMGQFAQAMVDKKLSNNQFSIKTDKPDVEVSWQITGIRKDSYAEVNRIRVEEDKKGDEIGTLLHPAIGNNIGLKAKL